MSRIPVFARQKNIELLGRIGYAARAFVYGLVGIYGLLLVFREGGGFTDTKEVLQRLLDKPFGSVILATIALGLFFFSVWRALQAIRDYENRGTDLKGILARVGYGMSALAYAALSYHAINLIFHFSRQSKRSGETELAATLLSQDFGAIATAFVALVLFGVGGVQIFIAVKEKFMKHLSLPSGSRWICLVSKIGIIARGIVFCIMGWLFLRAAFFSSSREADGLKGAWKFLASLPFGSALVGAMAVGLLAFSLYGFTEAAYRSRGGARPA